MKRSIKKEIQISVSIYRDQLDFFLLSRLFATGTAQSQGNDF